MGCCDAYDARGCARSTPAFDASWVRERWLFREPAAQPSSPSATPSGSRRCGRAVARPRPRQHDADLSPRTAGRATRSGSGARRQYPARAVKRLPTRLDGPVLLAPPSTATSAASSWRPSARDAWAAEGVAPFVQDNHSRSRAARCAASTSRPPRARASSCAARAGGLDVVVDLRRGSPTFGEWEAFELDDEHGPPAVDPVGFGHGFCVLSELADFVYKCTAITTAADRGGDLVRGFRGGDRVAGGRGAPVLGARPHGPATERVRGACRSSVKLSTRRSRLRARRVSSLFCRG
jgi:dTDP-4-dehydrorhamnose 3,5-epimerase